MRIVEIGEKDQHRRIQLCLNVSSTCGLCVYNRKADNVSTLDLEESTTEKFIYNTYNSYILCSAEIQPLCPFFSKVKNPVVEVRITFLF